MTDRHPFFSDMHKRSRAICLLLVLGCWAPGVTSRMSAAEPVSSQNPPAPSLVMVESNSAPRSFKIQAYVVEGNPLLSTNIVIPLLSKYTGTNIGLKDLLSAASDLQLEYRNQGYPGISIAFVPEHSTDGIVTLNVAQTAIPQIIVSGVCYAGLSNGVEVASAPSAAQANAIPPESTNAVPPAIRRPIVPATPEEMAQVRAALTQKMADLDAQAKDTRVHVVSTNAGPRFEVEHYIISGNTLLSPESITQVITNIDGAYGTNVSFEGIQTVVSELGKAYHDRGYARVIVEVPQQKITNATVNLQVLEGRLAAINVIGNRYFSSNNVMRALPSLHTDMVLNVPIFNAELNRANASRDRTIYPVIGPGPEPGTSKLDLTVKDRLPLHAKVELNNQSSPGTPDLRLNTSAVYDNLWQLEHSLGIQYGFSPETFKQGKQWDLYDQPLVANYSGFYRLPLGSPQPIETIIANNPGSFGYSEATRQFRLPPPSGQTELNVYASRATVDTALLTTLSRTIEDIPGFLSVRQQNVQQDITVNENIGARMSVPVHNSTDFQSGFSGGLDYKTYRLDSVKTNGFFLAITTFDQSGNPNSVSSAVYSPVPEANRFLQYLPLSLRYDGTWRSPKAIIGFGLGVNGNVWYSSYTTISSTGGTNHPTHLAGRKSLQGITGSTESSGHWLTLNPNLSIDFIQPGGWRFSVLANGQWASEPLVSTEQFGIGGIESVRGYHEGEVFGDTGWHISLKQQTPPHIVGMVHGTQPLTIRGSVFMDWGTAYLLDPQGRPNDVELWGTGLGLTASVGSHWQSRFLFSLPLIGTSTTPTGQPFFNFGLTAQF